MIPVCPKCDVGLIILNFKEIEVDFCDRCRGLWLDAGELEALMESTGATADAALLQSLNRSGSIPRGRKYLCPRCDQPMLQMTMDVVNNAGENLVIERCPHGDGLWFDEDELKRLLTVFPPESGASKTIDYLNELFGFAHEA